MATVVLVLAVAAARITAQSGLGSARTVLAAVVNGQGRPVVDVALDDVVVTEGNAARDVLDVHVADYPLVVVLDDRAGLASSIGAVTAAARRFIQRVGERPVALVRLSNGSHALATLEDERSAVLEKLAELKPGGDVQTDPLETIQLAAALLKATGAPFSAVIVVAAGPVDASALVRGELLPQIIDSGAAVHVVQAQSPGSGDARRSPGAPDLMRLRCRSDARSVHGDLLVSVVRRGARSSCGSARDRVDDPVHGAGRTESG